MHSVSISMSTTNRLSAFGYRNSSPVVIRCSMIHRLSWRMRSWRMRSWGYDHSFSCVSPMIRKRDCSDVVKLRAGEAAALHFMLTRLQEEGYSVFAQPSHAMLPTFLRGYRPDAIALKDGKNVAIEVVQSGGEEKKDRLVRLRELLADHHDWELRVFHAPPLASNSQISPASRQLIEEQLGRA